MPAPRVSEADFIELYEKYGPRETARRLKMSASRVTERRRNMEGRIGRSIHGPNTPQSKRAVVTAATPHRALIEPKGVVLVASDAHYWPNIVTTAHRAFVKMIRELQPSAVIMNGDVFDGASVSRHPPIGWESRPSVIQEIEACKERLEEIERAAKNAKLIWTLGNHDGRFSTRLATVAPEYAKVHGVHLNDHFQLWRSAWSCWIGQDCVVKHRYKAGHHATHNNTVYAGKTMVTGHLHSLKVTPFSDYNGTRWGVDTGTLADPTGPQFIDYLEDNPTSWRSGFAVLTYYKGELLWPELCHVRGEGVYEFRGKVYNI
jgi:hypothetical protein